MSEYRSLGMRMSPYADITQIRFTGLISAADIRPQHPGIRVNAIIIYHLRGIIQNKAHLENSIIVRRHLHIRQDMLTLIGKVGDLCINSTNVRIQFRKTARRDNHMKIIIIGGVAAGASAAARLRRLDEKAEIILMEKGEAISYANCGLPYRIGNVIAERGNLLVMKPAKFASWFNIEVRTKHEVADIDTANRTVTVNGPDGQYSESYDKLLLATGAMPAGERFTDETHPRLMHLWTLADMDRVVRKLEQGAKSVIVVGAGFIGLEVAENLKERGLDVTVIQRGGHVLPTLDKEMAQPLAAELASLGINVKFGCTVKDYGEKEDGLHVLLDNGETLSADMAIISTGVQPNTALAQKAGLQCGPRGHIIVNDHLQTSDPDIYAAGDAVEVVDPIFGGKTAIALAGPANKQGRIAADNIAGGSSVYRGTFGVSVVKVGGLTAGSVGLTEDRLKSMGKPFRKLYIHPSSGASYYPGAMRLDIKLLFGDDGAIYGAQIIGRKGVDKRIDTIAQAMRNGLKAPQLGEIELAYAPPYSSAKDPVNFAGFVAENILTGVSDVVYPDTIPDGALILDVREPEEHALGAIPNAINIRLGDLRQRLNELDKSRLIVCHCQVGLRGYLAERILKQNGFKAANLSGGWLTWKMFHPDDTIVAAKPKTVQAAAPTAAIMTLDVRALPCPGPVIKLKEALKDASAGQEAKILAAFSFEGDLPRWCSSNGWTIVANKHHADYFEAVIRKEAVAEPSSATMTAMPHSAAIVLFSNDFDKAMAAMILANGLAASGAKVGIFFTFWGLTVLRKTPEIKPQKNFISKMFGWMLPSGAKKLALSKMNMMGMGTSLMKSVMQKQNIASLPELIQSAKAAGVKFIACEMAMNVMGITRDELIDVDEVAGVAAFAELAKNSNNTLFI